MTTNTIQIKPSRKNKTNWVQYVTKNAELIAAITSGIIILITWSLKGVLPTTLWVLLHLLAFGIGGYAQAKEGILDTIQEKRLNVELLMVIAAIGSALIGYWTEGAILIFIFALAGALETYTLDKSNKEIASLMAIQPEEAVIIREGKRERISVKDLHIGDLIVVRASERIPADGKIIDGTTAIDESTITGESVPSDKSLEANVFAGTVALDGSIIVEITKSPNETLFQKIIQMVQSAKEEKSEIQLFIEKFESTYVNIVIVSVIIMMFLPSLLFHWTLTESIYRAMVLLVVASPCALVASIMPATLAAISSSARIGVLFKGGVHAENINHIRAVAFDKTGTLTRGKPVVTDVFIHPDYDEEKVITTAAAIEAESTHSLAQAITAYGSKYSNLNEIEVRDMKTISGIGVRATINEVNWKIGKPTLVGVDAATNFHNGIAKKFTNEGKTVVFVKAGRKVIAVFALQDTVRPSAKKVIKQLTKRGIHTVMLTGDNEGTAKAIAREAGIKEYIAECLPDEKVNHIRMLKKKHKNVAMVGDGINDAPALALADIGIAMGEGTDVAIETADVALMNNDLTKISEAMDVSKKMNRIIKQNIFFSLSIILILITSNFLQAIDLPIGVIGHEGSTILVILNGLRLLK